MFFARKGLIAFIHHWKPFRPWILFMGGAGPKREVVYTINASQRSEKARNPRKKPCCFFTVQSHRCPSGSVLCAPVRVLREVWAVLSEQFWAPQEQALMCSFSLSPSLCSSSWRRGHGQGTGDAETLLSVQVGVKETVYSFMNWLFWPLHVYFLGS